jgi:protein-disulfide isomerase
MQRPVSFLIALIAVALVAVFAASRLTPAPGASSAMAPSEASVRAYLMGHPDIARDALAQLEARETAQPGAREAPADVPPTAAEDSAFHPGLAQMETTEIVRALLNNAPLSQVAGNPHGDVTVIAFFDYRCPYCKQGIADEKVFLAADANARIVYRDLAILGAPSVVAARAALAAARQHKYLPLHDALMTYRGEFNDTDIFGLAMQVGLDIERLKADMEAPEIAATLTANLALARALKVEGTPAYVVGDRVVSGVTSADELAALAAEVRARGKQVGAR